MDHSLLAFVGVCVIVIVIPGPDTALTIRSSLGGGRGAGIATAFGVVAGQLGWELATAAGLTAILLASERVFHLIKLAGALYLVVLGVQALLAAVRGQAAAAAAATTPGVRPARAFHQGLISNLGNPKMAVFFASIFPQFVPRGHATFAGLMSLGLVFSALTLGWLCLYACVIDRAAGFFRRSRVQRGIESLTGAALVALGTKLALEKE